MVCPFCENSNSKVVESRESPDGVRRRRECSRCGLRFTTYERVYKKSIMIIKRDGRREPFSQEKLENSLVLKLRSIRGKPIISGLELTRSDLPLDEPMKLEERQVFFGPEE